MYEPRRKHLRSDTCRRSYYRRLARPNLFKGDAIVDGEEITLVFRDDGGRTPTTTRRLSHSESREFILKVLGGHGEEVLRIAEKLECKYLGCDKAESKEESK